MWAPQQAALSDEMHLLMPDLPGFGRSRLEECGIGLSVEACASCLRAGERPAVVVGVSYGGWVAVLLAARYPELVLGVLISGVRPRLSRSLVMLQAAAFRTMPAGRLKRGSTGSIEAAKIEKRNLIKASYALGEVDLMSSLARIKAPTVVFAPSRDWFMRAHVAEVAGAIPSATLIAVPDAGHLWTAQQPDRLTECIRAFLEEQTESA